MLGERLKAHRKVKRISQQYLADILNVNVTTILNWEKDKSKPTYNNMIKMAELFDIDIAELMGDLKEENLQKERETNWSVEKVIERFHEYRKKGFDITDKGLRENYPALRFQIIKKFSSYRKFLESRGINYDEIKKYNTWSKERIVKEFNRLQKDKVELHINNLRENHSRLLGAIERAYGSYGSFLKEIGIEYSTIKRYQNWNKMRVIQEFEKYASDNCDLRESTLNKNNAALYTQIRNYFGNYKVLLEELGFNYDEIRGKIEWTDKKIHTEFEEYLKSEKDLKASSINRQNTTLYNAIKRKYGEYGLFLELRGINYDEIRGTIEWTDEKVKKEYLELSGEHGGILSFTGLALKDNKLYQQVRKRFKGYKNFLVELGLKEEDIYKIIKFEQEIGLEFELLVKETFERLGYSYEYQYRGIKGIRPDFYDSTNSRIIDAKLSFYTGFKSYTPEKYLKYCKKLTLIYLRGKPFDYGFENLEVIPIDYYYDILKDEGWEYLIEKFEKLKKLLD